MKSRTVYAISGIIATVLITLALVWLRGDTEPIAPATPMTTASTPASAQQTALTAEASPIPEREPLVAATPAAKTWELRGTVLDAVTETPVVGAAVTIHQKAPGFHAVSLQKELSSLGNKSEPRAIHSARQPLLEQGSRQSDSKPSPDNDGFVLTANSDEFGRFVVREIPQPHFFVTVAARHKGLRNPLSLHIPDPETSLEQTLWLEPTAELVGVVMTPDGTPAAGATVQLETGFDPFQFVSGAMEIRQPQSVACDANGAYQIQSIPTPGPFQLRATLKPFAPSPVREVQCSMGQTQRVDLQLQQGSRLTVAVRSEDGHPIADATIRLLPASIDFQKISLRNEFDKKAKADSEGLATFSGLEQGEVQIMALASNYQRSEFAKIQIPKNTNIEHEIILDRGVMLRGHVRDPDGQPIPGARIRATRPYSLLQWQDTLVREHIPFQTSNAEGQFTLTGLPAQQVDLEVHASGYVSHDETLEPGGSDILVTLVPRSAIEGIVLSRIDNKLVKRFDVGLERQRQFSFNMNAWGEDFLAPKLFVFESDNGTFRIEDMDPGTYRLEIHAEGHAAHQSDWLEVAEQSTLQGLIFYLDPESRLIGQCIDRDTQAPVANASVRVEHGSPSGIAKVFSRFFEQGIPTDDEGFFDIGGLGAGSYQVTIRHPDYAEFSQSGIELEPQQIRRDLVFALEQGAKVYGVVEDQRGTPLINVKILASDATGTQIHSSNTDAQGFYEIANLAPGRYVLTKMPTTLNLSEGLLDQFSGGLETKNISLEKNQALEMNFGGRSATGTAKIDGVVRQNGEPVAGIFVAVVESGELVPSVGSGGGRTTATDSAGRFHFDSLQAGAVLVQAQTNRGEWMIPESIHSKTVRVKAGSTTTVVFELPSGEVKGRLVDGTTQESIAGTPVYATRVQNQGLRPLGDMSAARAAIATSAEDGSFVLRNLDQGEYRIMAGRHGFTPIFRGRLRSERSRESRTRRLGGNGRRHLQLAPGGLFGGPGHRR